MLPENTKHEIGNLRAGVKLSSRQALEDWWQNKIEK